MQGNSDKKFYLGTVDCIRQYTLSPIKKEPEPLIVSHVDTIDSIDETIWKKILNGIRGKCPPVLHAVLKEAQLISVDDSTLTVDFDPKFAWHNEQLKDSENKKQIESLISEVMGKSVTIQGVIMDDHLIEKSNKSNELIQQSYTFIIEFKPIIKSWGGIIRQLKVYKEYVDGNMVIITNSPINEWYMVCKEQNILLINIDDFCNNHKGAYPGDQRIHRATTSGYGHREGL
jgi:hypothetical protein